MHLLDIGCGIGGAASLFASEHRCRVTGIDLTSEFVQVAASLARRAGLAELVSYRQGSALSLPFEPGSFDGAYMIHVGMNIADKSRLFAEARRVLRPGGVFGIYDVMRTGEGELRFPVPWASHPETSFVAEIPAYRRLLEAGGFTVQKERNRRDFGIEFFRQMRERAAGGGPPVPGFHTLMGPDFPQKTANVIANLERGLIAPVELICRAV
jgi:SAM-dependent methyltransferase